MPFAYTLAADPDAPIISVAKFGVTKTKACVGPPRRLQRGSETAAGWDLFPHAVWLSPKNEHVVMVSTGIQVVDMDPSTYIRIAERSGLASSGLAVLGGVIDSDYRGVLVVMLYAYGADAYGTLIAALTSGRAIAQAIVTRIDTSDAVCVEDADSATRTQRGASGWGSSDVIHTSSTPTPPAL